jgi:hypothetical protein
MSEGQHDPDAVQRFILPNRERNSQQGKGSSGGARLRQRRSEPPTQWRTTMRARHLRSGRYHMFILLGLTLAAGVTGCGDKGLGTLHPVSGKVTLDGKPLTTGAVSFRPDLSRGNNSQHIPTGQIDPEGNYKLTTANRAGAPPGWYRVLVIAQDIGGDAGKKSGTAPGTKLLVPQRYLDPQSTPLSVEVVKKPASGAYDLNLTSKR